MKKIVVIAVVLVAFAAAAAVVVGNLRAHALHTQFVEELSGNSEIAILEDGFTPGVLSSSSTVHFALDPTVEEGEEPEVSMRIDNAIQHGALPVLGWLGAGASGTPVIARIETSMALAGEAPNTLTETFGPLPTLEIETLLRASGVGESHFKVEPFHAEGNSAGEFLVDWKGFEGKLVFTGNLEQIAGSFESGSIEVASALANFKSSSFSWTIDYDTDASGLPVGTTSFDLASVDFQPILIPAPSFTLEGLKFNQESRVENDRYRVVATNHFGQVTADGVVYGPGAIDFELRDLDASALAEVTQTLEEMKKRISDGEVDDQYQAEVGKKMIEALPALAAHSPELEFSRVSLATPEGTVRGKFEVNIDGSNPQVLQNPMMAVGAIRAKASAEIPAAIFASVIEVWARSQIKGRADTGELSAGDPEETLAYVRDSLIHNLRKQGLVVFDGERYTTRVDWSQGRLTINGMPVDPLELSMLTATPGSGMTFPDQAVTGGDLDGGYPADLGY